VDLADVPRLLMTSADGAIVAERTMALPELSDAAVRAVATAGVRYASTVHFKRAAVTGDAKLYGITPRFTDAWRLTAAAGVDIVAMLVADVSGDRPPVAVEPFAEMMALRYRTEEIVDAAQWRRLDPSP
jgi:predicted ATP-grasp superfamily ATP-dependent carboligase